MSAAYSELNKKACYIIYYTPNLRKNVLVKKICLDTQTAITISENHYRITNLNDKITADATYSAPGLDLLMLA